MRASRIVSLSLIGLASQLAAVEPADPLRIVRVASPIIVDGDLSDAAWQGAPEETRFFETNPGDSLPAEVASSVRLAYDDEFLYAAFAFEDPDPSQIRSPYGSHDDVMGNWTDYAGLIIDTAAEGKTAQMFLATASGVQYDAISSDASGEDSAPDFFWDAAGAITERGWNLEIRIPFASLRYGDPNPQQWGLMVYRNRPREFRYQYFAQKLPRDSACFICHGRPLVGLADLPSGSHWVVAPYAAGSWAQLASGGPGSSLESDDPDGRIGIDAKWIPNPNLVVDATIEPDFSQIESDAPQVTANERFALFFPEKRPFFLESVDLFSTPIQAAYTRTLNDPGWGLRATGGGEGVRYTLLVADDEGGGVSILPGPQGSSFAPQDDGALVAIGRVRRELGKGFGSFLFAARELDGGASNRVLGPDFEWRPTDSDQVVGQLLYSWSQTPNRPDLADEWDGRELSGHALRLWWYHQTQKWDLYVDGRDIDDEFRADSGFVPQVGYRRGYVEYGRTFRFTDAPVRRIRTFGWFNHEEDRDGQLLFEEAVAGFGLDATANTFARLEIADGTVANLGREFDRFQIRPQVEMRPGRVLALVGVYGRVGDDVDFVGNRAAKGSNWQASLQLRPNDHLAVRLDGTRRTLDLDEPGQFGRLFIASVAQLRTVWTFDSRSWLRVIARWGETDRETERYPVPVDAHDESFDISAVFSWQLNWQSVLYVGWSEERLPDERESLEPTGQHFFVKVSYAFQR